MLTSLRSNLPAFGTPTDQKLWNYASFLRNFQFCKQRCTYL